MVRMRFGKIEKAVSEQKSLALKLLERAILVVAVPYRNPVLVGCPRVHIVCFDVLARVMA